MQCIGHQAYAMRLKTRLDLKQYKLMKKSVSEGHKAAKQECAGFIDRLTYEAKQLFQAKIDLAALVAQHLVEQKLNQEPECIITMLSGLLKNISQDADVEVTLHPLDARVVKSSINKIFSKEESSRKLTVFEDDTFMRGSIVIKANKSIIDAHIRTQIDTAKEIIIFGDESKTWRS